MKSFPRVWLGALWIVQAVLATALGGQTAATKDALTARIDAIANEALESGLVGLSIAVISKGQPIAVKGYGFANLEHKVPATADTAYHICSVTKNFTAAAILQLADQGKVDLDADLTTYLPNFPLNGRHVTVRQLLNHTSGIRSYTEVGPAFDAKEKLDLSHEEVLATFQNEPADFAPGAQWHYSNSGFFLLGLIIEAVSGQLYADYLQQNIFDPHKLAHTCYCDNEHLVSGRAQPYVIARGKPRNADYISWKSVFSAGALCSTVMDLANWQRALDEGGVVKTAGLVQMRSPTQPAAGPPIDYGLGTRLGILDGHRCFGHSGNGAGYAAMLQRFPDDDLTVVVLTNTEGARLSPWSIAAKIARAVLGLPDAAMVTLPVPAAEQAAIAGNYATENGIITVAANGDTMVAKPRGSTRPGLVMPYQGQLTFVAGDPDHRIKFITTPDGSTWAVESSGGLFVSAAKRTP